MNLKKNILVIVVLISIEGAAFALPSYDEVRASYASSEALLLDRNGEVLHELRVDPRSRSLEWTSLADISPALVNAVIRSEDKRFRQHSGVDWEALASAAAGNMVSGTRRGASTITMQLVSLLQQKQAASRSKRTIGQKWDQIRDARILEKTWTKDQILEAYLNLVSFRGELRGITAASRGIFDKSPGGLDETESLILAALIRSPNAPAGRVADRAAMLARAMNSTLSPKAIATFAIDRLSRPYAVRRQVRLAPHAARQLIRPGEGKVVSTLDGRIQRFSLAALEQALLGLADRNVKDGAVLVVDNHSGDVLAYVGNAGTVSSAEYVDGVRAARQAGSTLKPFLYGLALEAKIITATSLIEDSPLDIPTERGIYRPENYDKEFRGLVTPRVALASSLNIPAVKTIGLVGTPAFVRKLRAFGFSTIEEASFYGPSLALGTADISLWELVNAYRTLANGGSWSRLRLFASETNGVRRQALSPGAAFIISDILGDREARSATFSLENPLSTRYWSAVKTGTSKDMRDNWCVGYSDRFTVGVWVGNFSGEPMWNVSGISGAAPVWLEIMNYLHRDNPGRQPAPPKGVVARRVTFENPTAGVRKSEWFLAGTEQETVTVRANEPQARITYPAEGMIIAIDPDIPADLQKVFFRTSSDGNASRLVLDEKVLGPASSASWQPLPGKHVLSLVQAGGSVTDSVRFEVR